MKSVGMLGQESSSVFPVISGIRNHTQNHLNPTTEEIKTEASPSCVREP